MGRASSLITNTSDWFAIDKKVSISANYFTATRRWASDNYVMFGHNSVTQ
ncbi:hypothetical protein L293_0259 [Acinetobacter gyllenbergii CIP 110306 = MTCC 11365]|nr:hypothetical protein L293_0259 [Acinetobacter gyllenbergii CIP 110306 = MTCC 11365]